MMTDITKLNTTDLAGTEKTKKTEDAVLENKAENISTQKTFAGIIGGPLIETKVSVPTDALKGVMESDKAVADLKKAAGEKKSVIDAIRENISGEVMEELGRNGIDAGRSDADLVEKSIDDILANRKERREAIEAEVDRMRELGEDTKFQGLTDAEKEIAKKLDAAGLAVTRANIDKVTGALELAESGTRNLGDTGISYMIENGSSQTIFNIYMAGHVAGAYREGQSDAVSFGAGLNDERLNAEWDQVKAQAENILSEYGVPIDEETMTAAKWLFANDLPINSDNIAEMLSLKNIAGKEPQADTADRIVDTMSLGGKAADTVLGDANERKAEYAINYINNIDAETIKDVTSRRKLEEIRLSLTYKAALSLYNKGISLDVKNLSEFVDRLKETEKEYFATLLDKVDPIKVKSVDETSTDNTGESGQNEENRAAAVDSAPTLKDQVELMSAVMSVRTYAISQAIDSDYMIGAISEVSESEGKARLKRIHEAGLAYDKGQTEIRKDLGDSVSKAVRNVDHLLFENGLPKTEANRRAAKMLAYNNAEINEESVTNMKKATIMTVETLQGLNPAVVAAIIKGGRNPLDMTANELFDTVTSLSETVELTEESYGAYLYKLDKKGQVSKKERTAYIGLYRLLNQIAKNDGADIGNVVLEGRELTLRNMLQSVRTRNLAGFDKTIDDDFGELAKVGDESKKIDKQIDAAYVADIAISLKSRLSEASREYYEDQSAELKRFLAECDNSMEELMTEGVRISAYNLAAEDDIKKGRKSLEVVKQGLPPEVKKAIGDKAFKAIDNMEDADSFADETSEINEELIEETEKQSWADDMTFERFSALMMAKRTLSLSVKRSGSQKFDIPLFYDGKAAELSVTIKNSGRAEEGGKIELKLFTEEGELQGDFNLNKGRVSGFISAQDEQMAAVAKFAVTRIPEVLNAAGFTSGEISYQKRLTSSEIRDLSDINNSKENTREVYRAAKVITKSILSVAQGRK